MLFTSALFSQQSAFFDQELAQHGDPANPGHAFGVQMAQALLADRASDPPADDTGYNPSPDRSDIESIPTTLARDFMPPFYGAQSKGFVITRVTSSMLLRVATANT